MKTMNSTSLDPRGCFTPEREYREVMEKRAVDRAWLEHLTRFRWQLYGVGTFAHEVSLEHAQRAGSEFVTDLGPTVYAALFLGRGEANERAHLHFLIGGLWHGKLPSAGLDRVALSIRRVERAWRHGVVPKLELFDAERFGLYLTDHHEVTIVGSPERFRPRGKRGRGSPRTSSD